MDKTEMKETERDRWDDWFREKLHDFEADVEPKGWQQLSRRLPAAKTVPLRHVRRHWAAAAAVLLLVVVGGRYLFDWKRHAEPLAEVAPVMQPPVSQENPPLAGTQEPVRPAGTVRPLVAQAIPPVTTRTACPPETEQEETTPPAGTETVAYAAQSRDETEEKDSDSRNYRLYRTETDEHAELSASEPRQTAPKSERKRRWSFGMGAGSIGTGSSDALAAYALQSSSVANMELMQLNSPYFNDVSPKTDIRHKTPVSVGAGIAYRLTDRLALQSGLTYTFLASEWKTGGRYSGETKQKLHFVGIPLSLSYTFAAWRRLQFYAAAGAMTEVNVAGKRDSKMIVGGEELRRESEHVRMKEWLWSVDARIGAVYPLLRFVSIYAEAGAGYYFDNGSEIETVRSEKPFNVSLQAGVRLGF